MRTNILPYGIQKIDADDIRAVVRTLKGDWLTTGPSVEKFEQKFADYVGARYAIAVSSATAALHLAVQAAGIPKGMAGITTPITFVASANAFLYNDIKPIFADIDPTTYNISPLEIKKQLTRETRIVIPVHMAGLPCDMESISKIANTLLPKMVIIEDASHAIGGCYPNGAKIGSCFYGGMTVFSFHPVKTMTTGEGGMITTNDEHLASRLKKLRSHGIVREPTDFVSTAAGPWYYEMQELGYNYRLTDIQAALGLSQLRKLDKFVAKRQSIVDAYNSAFSEVNWITTPQTRNRQLLGWHLYIIQIDFEYLGMSREKAVEILKNKGVGTQVHYIPIHLQPYYRREYGFKPGQYPHAENYYQHCLSLPLYPGMTKENIKHVVNSVKSLGNNQ